MKLIFFTSSDPSNPKPIWSAHHFARTAAQAGLDAEVRLGGDAVRVAQEGSIAATELGADLSRRIVASVDEPYVVSLCPNSAATHALSEEQIQSIGGTRRPLAEILTEVADGRSTLIHMG